MDVCFKVMLFDFMTTVVLKVRRSDKTHIYLDRKALSDVELPGFLSMMFPWNPLERINL